MARNAFRKTAPLNHDLPDHEHASDHRLLEAIKVYKTKQRLKLAQQRRPSAEIAAERIRELLWDLGAEHGWHRWVAASTRAIGADSSYCRLWEIATGRATRVGPGLVDKIANFTGIPAGVFYDQDEVWNGNGRS